MSERTVVQLETTIGVSTHPQRLQDELSLQELRIELAMTHDKRARELEHQITATWSELAEICTLVRDNHEAELLGYSSFNQWLLEACPKSRAMVYSAMGLIEELKHIPAEILREIPIGSAHILKLLPRALREAPETLEAAKVMPPRKFLATVSETHPALHIEKQSAKKFYFSTSQWKQVAAAMALIGLLEDVGTEAEQLEGICVEYLNSHQEEAKKIIEATP